MIRANVEVEEEVVLDVEELLKNHNEIVLYNDDYNSFDFVIESLVDVCKHSLRQAEQCTYLVHYKGRCSVKRGTVDALKPMCTALLDRGLTAEIQ